YTHPMRLLLAFLLFILSLHLVLHASQIALTFFFSSRRRHTRFSRDWSSDVCSSDLDGIFTALATPTPPIVQKKFLGGRAIGGGRTEERRAGKECEDVTSI